MVTVMLHDDSDDPLTLSSNEENDLGHCEIPCS